jgi:hypothetical protein
MVNLIETEPEGAENGDDDTPEYEEEELADANQGIPLSPPLVIQRLLLTLRQGSISKAQDFSYSLHSQPEGM